MHLIYIDDSGDESFSIYSALLLPADQWKVALAAMRHYRSELKQQHGIFVYKELHAWKFVSGRGRISDRIITRYERVKIFNNTLDVMTQLPGAKLMNVIAPKSEQMRGYERLLNRINRSLETWNSQGIIISDKGNEIAYTRLIRRMGVYNPIPSRQGKWGDSGSAWRNIPIDRILEDPFFKDSEQSHFIQLCDFAAYSLLKREHPLESRNRYGLDSSFSRLASILVREANPRDPDGIIRL